MLSLLELSLTGGVFILAVVVVRALAMNRLPRQAFLLLWAVALARLLLPFSIPSPTSLYSAAGHLGEGFRRAGIVTAGGTDAAGDGGPLGGTGGIKVLQAVRRPGGTRQPGGQALRRPAVGEGGPVRLVHRAQTGQHRPVDVRHGRRLPMEGVKSFFDKKKKKK